MGSSVAIIDPIRSVSVLTSWFKFLQCTGDLPHHQLSSHWSSFKFPNQEFRKLSRGRALNIFVALLQFDGNC